MSVLPAEPTRLSVSGQTSYTADLTVPALLVRHEITGTDLATLAGEADVSNGAIAMRLARARANLRLEFLLVFRRLALPTAQCRPVLLAVAAGDRRRQAQLDATAHVETCETGATLVTPMTERNRRVAAWLFVPLGDAVRQVRRWFRSWWAKVATAVMLMAGVAWLIVLVNDPSGNDTMTSEARSPGTRAAAASAPTIEATAAATTGPVAPASPPTTELAGPPASGSAATIAAPAPSPPSVLASAPPPTTPAAAAPAQDDALVCPPPAPLIGLDLPYAVGCPFAVSVVTSTPPRRGPS